MANKSTDMDKEMAKLLEHFAQEYHKIVVKETVTKTQGLSQSPPTGARAIRNL